jgi:hypothetical protein
MPTLVLRYEDLRQDPLPGLMRLVQWLLPQEEVPSLSDLMCATELDQSKEAYHSDKRPPFESWSRYTPEARQLIVNITRPFWCRHGYQLMATELLSKDDAASLQVDCTSEIPARFDEATPERVEEAIAEATWERLDEDISEALDDGDSPEYAEEDVPNGPGDASAPLA